MGWLLGAPFGSGTCGELTAEVAEQGLSDQRKGSDGHWIGGGWWGLVEKWDWMV